MKKCEYCESESTTVYGRELLCERHYNILYSKKDKVKQLLEVPKIKREEQLNKRYMTVLKNIEFFKKQELDEILLEFKRDVKMIKNLNKLYR